MSEAPVPPASDSPPQAKRRPALRSFHITQFRGLRDLSFDPLGRVNLLVGVNNSGKSSVLEAMALMQRPLDQAAWIDIAWGREVKGSRKPVSESVALFFPRQESGLLPIRLEQRVVEQSTIDEFFTPGRVSLSATASLWQVLQEQTDLVEPAAEAEDPQGTEEALAVEVEVGDFAVGTFESRSGARFDFRTPIRIPRQERKSYLPTCLITPHNYRDERASMSRLGQLSDPDLLPRATQALRLIDPEIEELIVWPSKSGRSPEFRVMRGGVLVPFSMLGDGVRRVLAFALAIPSCENGLLIIDEIESALHASALSSVFTWLVQAAEQFNIQIVATTHSLEAVDAVADSCEAYAPESFRFFRLEAPGSRHRLTRFDLSEVRGLREDYGADLRGMQ